MEESITNTTVATSVTITQAQIVTTAVIGSLLLTLVVLNLIMYSIYTKLTQTPKVTVKISKQESVQLYQIKSTGQYNTLSHSSISQSQGRINTIRTVSLSGDDITSVEYSTMDITQSYNPNTSMEYFSEQDVSYQLNTSKDMHKCDSNQSNVPNPDATNSVETEAQIHEDSLPRMKTSQGLSDIHLYQCFKSQMEHKKIRRGSKSDKVANLPAGITREDPIEMHKSTSKDPHKVKGYVDMTDFDNDTDTEVNVRPSMDIIQGCIPSKVLDSPGSLLGRPVVEFQNKAFEFSETKTALEEVADTDL